MGGDFGLVSPHENFTKNILFGVDLLNPILWLSPYLQTIGPHIEQLIYYQELTTWRAPQETACLVFSVSLLTILDLIGFVAHQSSNSLN